MESNNVSLKLFLESVPQIYQLYNRFFSAAALWADSTFVSCLFSYSLPFCFNIQEIQLELLLKAESQNDYSVV